MSFATWKKEFMPTEPDSCESRLEAAEHALAKWRGLSDEVLAKHGLERTGGDVPTGVRDTTVTDPDAPSVLLLMSGSSCALCVWADETMDDEDPDEDHCELCPLYIVRGSWCAGRGPDGDEKSPYDLALRGDTDPLIELLERGVEWAKNNQEAKE